MRKTLVLLSLLFACICYCCDGNDETAQPEPPLPEPPVTDTTTVEGINPDAILSYGIKSMETRASVDTFAQFATYYAWHIKMNEGWVKDISGIIDTTAYYTGRDTANYKFKFRGWDVIKEDSTLGTMILAHDVLLCAAKDTAGNYMTMLEPFPPHVYDTIAYIPNQKLRDNLKIIQGFYDNRQFDSVYQMFDTAYNFIPITGAEWLKLKSTGIE